MVDWVLGADVGGTKIKYTLGANSDSRDLQGEVDTDPADPVGSISRLVAEIRRRRPDSMECLAAVGMACAGIVSQRTGRLGRSPNLPGWENLALADLISDAFGGLPSVVVNDVNAALYGEYRLGAGRGCDDLVMLALGTGVGGGVIVGGRLVTGAADGAGEIGHMVLDPAGPLCSCGSHGCLEAYAGGMALLRRARELTHDGGGSTPVFRTLVIDRREALTTADLYHLAEDGDATARFLFQTAGEWLGQAVANVVNLLDPDRVIIGGGVALAGDLIIVPCRSVVRELVLSEASRELPIVPAALGPFAAALGAAALARERKDLP